MSVLWPHARAMLVLAQEWQRHGRETRNQHALMTARVHYAAASRLEAEIAANTGRQESGPIFQFSVEPPEPETFVLEFATRDAEGNVVLTRRPIAEYPNWLLAEYPHWMREFPE